MNLSKTLGLNFSEFKSENYLKCSVGPAAGTFRGQLSSPVPLKDTCQDDFYHFRVILESCRVNIIISKSHDMDKDKIRSFVSPTTRVVAMLQLQRRKTKYMKIAGRLTNNQVSPLSAAGWNLSQFVERRLKTLERWAVHHRTHGLLGRVSAASAKGIIHHDLIVLLRCFLEVFTMFRIQSHKTHGR